MNRLIDKVRTELNGIMGPFLPEKGVETGGFVPVSEEKLASAIDHTLLKPEATPEQITKLCREAKEYRFASVCVNPVYVSLAASELRSSSNDRVSESVSQAPTQKVAVCTVIDFPLGASPSAVKAFETDKAIQDGATEIDMVIPIGLLKAGEYQAVLQDIQSVVQSAKKRSIVKVIIETCLLTDEEKIAACLLAQKAGADFVKTSTGFGTGGATQDDILLMRETVGPHMGVKASGGIRTRKDALLMLAAGATRIGASASVAIVKGE